MGPNRSAEENWYRTANNIKFCWVGKFSGHYLLNLIRACARPRGFYLGQKPGVILPRGAEMGNELSGRPSGREGSKTLISLVGLCAWSGCVGACDQSPVVETNCFMFFPVGYVRLRSSKASQNFETLVISNWRYWRSRRAFEPNMTHLSKFGFCHRPGVAFAHRNCPVATRSSTQNFSNNIMNWTATICEETQIGLGVQCLAT